MAASADRELPGRMGGSAKDPSYVSVHGARVIGALLMWDGAAGDTVRSGLGALEPADISTLALHPAGSKFLLEPLLAPGGLTVVPHEVRASMYSLRRKVIKHLKGQWAALATDRAGSWLVEKAFLGADLPTRARMTTELAASERVLTGTPAGRAVLRLLRVQHFKNQRSSWDAMQTRQMAEAAAEAKAAARSAAEAAAAAKPKKAKKEKKEKKEKKAKKEKHSTSVGGVKREREE